MSIDIYPAFQIGNAINHADDWNDDSTINVANGNFYTLVDTLGISQLAVAPGHIKVKTLEVALQTAPHTRYTERLIKLCAIARIKKAPLIAFA